MTVEALCRRDANLITADTAINFMLSKLKEQRGSFSNKFAEQLISRIKQRSTCLTSVLKYLQNLSDYYTNKNENVTAPSLDSQQIAEVIYQLQRLGRSDSPQISQCNSRDDWDEANVPSTSSTTAITLTPKTMAEELQETIEKSMSRTKESSRMSVIDSEFGDDLMSVIKVEMALYENGGVKGKYLLQVYDSLLKVPPTSLESERVFSSAGYLCNHLKTKLNDDTLDVLSMLRSHYQSLKNNCK
ncbi:uncharacterized protein [Choristoneura fumiferana]|uniref:uncharacterized protein n=1 Tax=Choristoneura fumiferana TaxID=7141 RepID=UPI003D1598BB